MADEGLVSAALESPEGVVGRTATIPWKFWPAYASSRRSSTATVVGFAPALGKYIVELDNDHYAFAYEDLRPHLKKDKSRAAPALRERRAPAGTKRDKRNNGGAAARTADHGGAAAPAAPRTTRQAATAAVLPPGSTSTR